MKHLQLKDKKLRHLFQKSEFKLKLKKFIFVNLTNLVFTSSKFSFFKKKLFYYQILRRKKKTFLTKIVRRCVLTNRSKSLRFSKMSRIVSKELISFGIIPGYKKAVW